jgi:hypothetical protein
MKVLLEIKDNKADFVMELLQSLSYVKAKQLTPGKAQLVNDLNEAVAEMKLIKAGRLKGIPAKELLNEL